VGSRTRYHARPQLIRAGRHGAWRGLAAHLLFEQVVAKVKSLEFDANGPWRPLCFRSIAVTSDSKAIVKKNCKMRLFRNG
jgi:hypothetical protein